MAKFQIGCMTLPYSPFPLERALDGIAKAGCRYVGWGTTHQKVPVMAPDAPPAAAKTLAARCRDLGLEPVMMFAAVYVDATDSIQVHTSRIRQAAAAGIPYIITFGHTAPGSYEVWVEKPEGNSARWRAITAWSSRSKQHGGNSGTGKAISKLLADVGDQGVRMCYDAGNVLDYENLDPIPDIQACWRDVRTFAIKDHRRTPQEPGLRAGLRRDRSLQAAAAGPPHGADHAR